MKLTRSQARLIRVAGFFALLFAGSCALILAAVLLGSVLSAESVILIGILLAALTGFLIRRLMVRRTPRKVPVVMYHCVADNLDLDGWKGLVIPVDLFRRQLQWLKKKGYETLLLPELLDRLEDPATIPQRAISLTFDDGFLDNWTVVFPLLREFGLKGTFFVTTNFIETGGEPRPTLADLNPGDGQPQVNGYMSWVELAAMVESGLAEVQSHSVSHSWCFTGPGIVDFYGPGKFYPWIPWNETPDRSADWLRDPDQGSSLYGLPVYEHGRNLVSRRYVDDPRLRESLMRFVREKGGGVFLGESGWEEALFREAQRWRSENEDAGHMEDGGEYDGRVLRELRESREVLERRLGVPVRIFCWPGDRYTDRTLDIAVKEAGYRATTSDFGYNMPGGDLSRISRSYVGAFFSGIGIPSLDMLIFKLKIGLLEGNFLYYIPLLPLYLFKKVYVRMNELRSPSKEREKV